MDSAKNKKCWIGQYKLSQHELELVDEEMKSLIKNKVIERSYSNHGFNSSVMTVKKGNGGLIRMCIDFRLVNKIIEDTPNWIPNIKDIFENIFKVGGCNYFSRLDLKSAYNQILINPSHRYLTTFSNPNQLNKLEQFQFIGCPFGLKNLPYEFQQIIQGVLDKLGMNNVGNFQDDIWIFDKDIDNHFNSVFKVISHLNKYNLKLNLKKCEFLKVEIKLLGS
jgi:hypothetical protein